MTTIAIGKKPSPEMFEISVRSGRAGQVRVTIDGEESVMEGFEFAVPIGTGLVVRRVLRVELTPPTEDTLPIADPYKY